MSYYRIPDNTEPLTKEEPDTDTIWKRLLGFQVGDPVKFCLYSMKGEVRERRDFFGWVVRVDKARCMIGSIKLMFLGKTVDYRGLYSIAPEIMHVWQNPDEMPGVVKEKIEFEKGVI